MKISIAIPQGFSFCPDKKIARHYARFDSWRGLALWCDMTRDWIEEEQG